MAAERTFGLKPAGMYYVGIKGGVEYAQWQATGDWAARAAERTLQIVGDIRGGRVEVAPVDTGSCRFCDSHDICRVEVQPAGAAAETA
jgi:hypothetical protein